MTTVTNILKYELSSAGGVVGQNPFKIKAKLDHISNWKFTDKLNKLKTFEFTVPNNEFTRANTFLERKTFVPLIEPFRGIVCKKESTKSSISMMSCELAFHLTRQVFRVDFEPRPTYTKDKWFDPAWKFRKRIVINKSFVGGAIKNFPVAVHCDSDFLDINFDCLAVGQNGSSQDIRFTEADGVTPLTFEIERFVDFLGALIIWVKIPEISPISNTEFYIYYGNPGQQPASDIPGVWNDIYTIRDSGTAGDVHFPLEGVWHLKESPAATPPEYENSVSPGTHDGTETDVTIATAQLGIGALFNGTTSEIDCGSGSGLDNLWSNADAWLTAVINPASDGEGDEGVIVSKANTATPTLGWKFYVKSEVDGFCKLAFLQDTSSTSGVWETTNAIIPIGEFTNVAVSYDDDSQTTNPVFWVNAVKLTVGDGLTETATPTGTETSDSVQNLIIGNVVDGSGAFDGIIDEVKIMHDGPGVTTEPDEPIKDGIIRTIHNNQQRSEDFMTFFHQEQFEKPADLIAQDIIDNVNLDTAPGITWTLGQGLSALFVNGPALYIDFDTDVVDETLTPYTVTQEVTDVTFRNSIDSLGSAGLFDESRFVKVLDNNALDNGVSSYGYGCVFKLETLPSSGSNDYALISKNEEIATPTLADYGLSVLNSNDKLRATIIETSTTNVDSIQALKVGKWYKVWVNVNTATPDIIELWLDGVLQGTGSIAGFGASDNVGDFLIGAKQTTTTINKFRGLIDEVRVQPGSIGSDTKILFSTITNTGLNRVRNDDISTKVVTGAFHYKNHFDALQALGELVGKDVFFDNEQHIVFLRTKGKTLAQELDIVITSKPEVDNENFANIINVLGKKDEVGKPVEVLTSVESVLRFSYEKTTSDNQLSTIEEVTAVGDQLLKEFQKLTPQIKGELPYEQFKRLNLESGDVVKISQPEKQVSGSFRIMQIQVTSGKAKLALESTETGFIRLRSLSLTDVIGGILKRLETQSIDI